MGDLAGMSVKRLIVTVLAVLGLIFFIAAKESAKLSFFMINIMVTVYLLVILLMSLLGKSDSSNNLTALDAAFAVELFITTLPWIVIFDVTGWTLAAMIMNLCVGSLLILFLVI